MGGCLHVLAGRFLLLYMLLCVLVCSAAQCLVGVTCGHEEQGELCECREETADV